MQRYRECCIFIEILATNITGLENLIRIYRFVSRSTQTIEGEKSIDNSLVSKMFQEYHPAAPGNLSHAELESLKDELPMEIIIQYCTCLLKVGTQGTISTSLKILKDVEELSIEEHSDSFIDIINLYSDFNYFEKALSICQKLLEHEGMEGKNVILQRIAVIYDKMGDTVKQVETLKRILEIDPENKRTRLLLSEIYEKEGLYTDALNVIQDKNNWLQQSIKLEHEFANQHNYSDEEAEIFLSDDENPEALGKRDTQKKTGVKAEILKPTKIESEANPLESQPMKFMKVEGLIKDIKNEGTLHSKTRKRMVNIVELNEQFFTNLQSNIDEIISKHNLEVLLLEMKELELYLKSAEGNPSAENAPPETLASKQPEKLPNFKCIKSALKLEQKKLNLTDNIYQLLLNESKGKIRSTFQGAVADNPELKKDLNYLFIFKRKKHPLGFQNGTLEEPGELLQASESLMQEPALPSIKRPPNAQGGTEMSRIESLFKESKNKSKVANKLAEKIITKLKTVPDYLGMDKFINIIIMSLKHMYLRKKYPLLSKICEILYRINKKFDHFPHFQQQYHFFGFLSLCRQNNFEKAYIFFRIIAKHLILDSDAQEKPAADQKLRGEFMKLFEGYEQSDINKVCFCMINHLFSEFGQQSSAQRIFFQKFQKQYVGGENIQPYVNMISANNYIASGSNASARLRILEKNDLDTNPLSNFLMGYLSMVETTNRTNENKIQSFHESLEYFEKYKSLVSKSRMPEVNYNFSRFLSHMNMMRNSLKMMQKCEELYQDKLQEASQCSELKDKLSSVSHFLKKKMFVYDCEYNKLVWARKAGNREEEIRIIKSMFE